MKKISILGKSNLFMPLTASKRAQAAVMVLKPGRSSSPRVENEHPKAEQWLFVVSGKGRARVGRRVVRLARGTLLLIEQREPHQITNTGRRPLVTLNLYAPPAYTRSGEVRAAVGR